MELRAYARERALHCSEFNVTKYWSHVGDRADLKGGEQECGDHHHDGQQLFADDARQANKGRVLTAAAIITTAPLLSSYKEVLRTMQACPQE